MDTSEAQWIKKINKFKLYFEGEIHTDIAMRTMYATDASLYAILPIAVAYPKNDKDLKNIILFAQNQKISLIPRTAGTSLGGQCVGEGIVVDVSRYLNQIIEINPKEKWAIVQPGVIRDELIIALKPYNLHFGPNTSTSNRAMIGGMVGNNSSGSYSIKYGTTREHVLEVSGFLSDGTSVTFGDISTVDFRKKTHGVELENAIYRQISFELSHPLTQDEILHHYPKSSVTRRNTGYAVDQLLDCEVFEKSQKPFNFSKMLCGSEGTLMMFSQIKVHLVDSPSNDIALICFHFDSLEKSLLAAVEAMTLSPNQCELMDKTILDCTKDNILQSQNRFFIQGDPAAILMVEVEAKPNKSLNIQIEEMIQVLDAKSFAYANSTLYGDDIKKALQLRASGLGVLQHIKGLERPLEFVEDTAVAIADLPNYIAEFQEMIASLNSSSVYYAHAGAGELHIRPKVNLKTVEGRQKFRAIAERTAHLVKKYQGSLSGEHGDGMVRGEFIPIVLGKRNYELLKRIKNTWDPQNIFNPNKIVDAYPMDSHLKDIDFIKSPITKMNFGEDGWIDVVEKCSGSGDCRKTEIIGGTLCPSYQATREERYSTRARANILKNYLQKKETENPLDEKDIYDTLKMCLGCKACISECPSSIDIASSKSEFLYQYQKTHAPNTIQKAMANFGTLSQKIAPFAYIVNLGTQNDLFSWIPKKIMGIPSFRSIPKFSTQTVSSWAKKRNPVHAKPIQKIYLWVDEFTNRLDAEMGIKAILLLETLGIEVEILPYLDSARSLISKGMLDQAQDIVRQNIDTLQVYANDTIPIIGIEPSSILGIRDDYKRLITDDQKAVLEKLSAKTFLIDEFLANYFDQNPSLRSLFSVQKNDILFHGHCHQKALSHTNHSLKILNFPQNYTATEIPSGCCGMAGSFGYEQVEMSQKVGNLVLFPTINESSADKIICANGTSCRHQIKDGTHRRALHPVEILYDALISRN